jgi:hypothetical protein
VILLAVALRSSEPNGPGERPLNEINDFSPVTRPAGPIKAGKRYRVPLDEENRWIAFDPDQCGGAQREQNGAGDRTPEETNAMVTMTMPTTIGGTQARDAPRVNQLQPFLLAMMLVAAIAAASILIFGSMR